MGGSPRVELRAARFERDRPDGDDLAVVAALVAASDRAVVGEVDSGDDEVSDLFASPLCDREATSLLLVDGEPVGFVWIAFDDTAGQTRMDLWVPPGPHRAAATETGLEHGVSVARRAASAAAGRPWVARSGIWAQDDVTAGVLAAHGFSPVRRFYRMRIDASSEAIPAVAPSLPDGVRIEVPRDEAGYRAVCAVDNEAFLDHWGFTPRDFDEWWPLMTNRSGYDPDGWWLLVVGDEPAAICLNDDTYRAVGDGYVGVLGVRRAFRGRGLASLLLRHAFVRDRDRGLAGTRLSVDSDNTSGAVGLYLRVGMTVTRTAESWHLPLA